MITMKHTVMDLRETFSKSFKEVRDDSHEIGSLVGRWTCVKMLGEKVLWIFNDLVNRIKLFAETLFRLFFEIFFSRERISERGADALDSTVFLCIYPFTNGVQILRLVLGCIFHPGIVLSKENAVEV